MYIEKTIEFYSDPTFNVFKVPKWRSYFYTFLSIKLWGNLPSTTQRKMSSIYCKLYELKWSKFLIKPYVRFNYSDKDYLLNFTPPEGKKEFESFQDFFIRKFKKLPTNDSQTVWPCEGLLCETGKIGNIKAVNIKNDIRNVETVFGLKQGDIPAHYNFVNVFLHNKNYHRIHAPVTGTITRIQHVPGDLVILRPWIYSKNPSQPAFRNERYNIDLKDEKGKIWHLSIVGGPAVGTIKLPNTIKIGEKIAKLEELAVFYLGSTCCMATPIAPRFHKKNCFVEVGNTY